MNLLSLFSLEPFVLPSGRQTFFKIECDALVKQDWEALARLAVELLPPFGAVEGVPRGGLEFAAALSSYTTLTSELLLIADDVWVTGKSMNNYRYLHPHGDGNQTIGVVAFTRGSLPSWVRCLFLMHAEAERATYQLDRAHNT
jgi:hypothetical protein